MNLFLVRAGMADQTSQAVQAALEGLQHALSSCGTCSCNTQMAQVNACVDGLLQQYTDVVRALENKSIAERALGNVVANKDAEAAQLRGEVQRLRSSTLQIKPDCSTSAADEQQPDETPSDADQSTAAADPDARQAVLSTAVAAKDKPTALVHQLESEVSACQSRITALEAELAAAAREHSSRLAQQQKAFLAKLEQLRQVHNQQVATVVHEAKKQLEQEKASSKNLEGQLEHLKQQLLQEQDRTTALQEQLQHLQQQHQAQQSQQHQQDASSSPGQAVSADTDTPAAADTTDATGQAPDTPNHDQVTGPIAPAHSKAAARAAAAAEVAALRDMEAQLLRLSGIVKSYQGEREQLRQALMAGCNERQALQQLVLELRAKLQDTRGSGSQDAPTQQATSAADNLSRAYWGSLTN